MSNLQKHISRVNALSKRLQPKPTIIDCTGAKEELLAMLEQQMRASGMTEDEIDTPVEWSEEDKAFIEKFDTYLDDSVRSIQETYSVRLVSYE